MSDVKAPASGVPNRAIAANGGLAAPVASQRGLQQGLSAPNPLPLGMRDILPPHAEFQSTVGRKIISSFGLFGYERVWLPLFEYVSVLERSRAAGAQSVRFVEPESGEVVALRADMTPQIARVAATRFGQDAGPIRLSYQGSVMRRRAERARLQSQVVQVGAELLGRPGIEGDFEILDVLCSALRATQLEHFVLDIGHSQVARSLLHQVAEAERQELSDALAAKDVAVLQRRGRALGLDAAHLRALVSLPQLNGGAELWPEAERSLMGTEAAVHARQLRGLWERVNDAGLCPQVLADLGEIRDLDYYNGALFQVFAHGPGEPIATGGRYDGLLGRFGKPRAAAGFAIDLSHVCLALERGENKAQRGPRVVLGPAVDGALASALRKFGVPTCSADAPFAYAKTWGYGWVIVEEGGKRLLRSALAAPDSVDFVELTEVEPDGQARQIAQRVRNVAGA